MTRQARALIVVVALGLAGCASASSASAPSSTAVTTNAAGQPQVQWTFPPSSSRTDCSITLYGHDATIVFSSPDHDVSPACRATVRLYASEGQLWGAAGASWTTQSGWGVVCTLHSSDVTARVYDDGGQEYGQQVCTGLLAAGWTEDPTPR